MFRHQVRTISTYNNIVAAAIESDQIQSEQSRAVGGNGVVGTVCEGDECR